jgi:hypothetical protein
MSNVKLTDKTVAELTSPDYLKAMRRINAVRRRPESKCGLPGCDVLTHLDYCSAEHCREHRRQQRENSTRT